MVKIKKSEFPIGNGKFLSKNGFTLIELLVILVILAVIALIAVPQVLNLINNSKKKSVKISVENYLKAVKVAIMNKDMNSDVRVLDGWYKVKDNGKILDHNTTNNFTWNDIGGFGPSTVFLEKLQNATSDWEGTEVPDNYTTGKEGNEYTIHYKDQNFKSRLITATEIAQIVNYKGWDERLTTSSWFYFSDKSQNSETGSGDVCSKTTEGCKYGWLYDRTAQTCKTYGCFNYAEVYQQGYWTASTCAGYSTNKGYRVVFQGAISVSSGTLPNTGIRPVIEVKKSNL